jgi:hypothetical protein
MDILVSELKASQENGILSFDPLTKRKCLLIPVLLCVLADNPRAAELTSTRGATAISPCRFCQVKLSQIKRGIHESILRDSKQAASIRSFASSRSSQQETESILKLYGIKETQSPFEKESLLGFDTFCDFPVEILHTILIVSANYLFVCSLSY